MHSIYTTNYFRCKDEKAMLSYVESLRISGTDERPVVERLNGRFRIHGKGFPEYDTLVGNLPVLMGTLPPDEAGIVHILNLNDSTHAIYHHAVTFTRDGYEHANMDVTATGQAQALLHNNKYVPVFKDVDEKED